MSSSDYAIRIKGLGKQYRIGVEQSGGMYKYKSLRDSLGSVIRSPVRTLRNSVLQEPLNEANSFWALKDVSFDVKRGEVVGIIGRNGAGKSTLLKILSRITRPTTGEIELHGRVGSLLEVGTGFHPELSGRENIYLNGAVLGMTRAEVKKKFDEIVNFSEIEKFLDTPVKQYSSGMYTRLAFAVAAHLEPEILVVDEVLAVGDAEFQRKCLAKMHTVAEEGRTVVFVSHNMGAIRSLCSDVKMLRGGRALDQMGLDSTVAAYLSADANVPDLSQSVVNQHGLRLEQCRLLAGSGQSVSSVLFGDRCEIRVALGAVAPFKKAGITLQFFNALGQLATSICPVAETCGWVDIVQRGELAVELPKMELFPGVYTVTVLVHLQGSPIEYLHVDRALAFTVDVCTLPDATWPYSSHHGASHLPNSMNWTLTSQQSQCTN